MTDVEGVSEYVWLADCDELVVRDAVTLGVRAWEGDSEEVIDWLRVWLADWVILGD